MIEYHPALLAHADDNAGGGNVGIHIAPASTVVPESFPPLRSAPGVDEDDISLSDSDSDLSDISECCSIASFEDPLELTPAERAEHERFGQEYKGPVFSNDHAARLLILMGHASTCPCQ